MCKLFKNNEYNTAIMLVEKQIIYGSDNWSGLWQAGYSNSWYEW